MAEAVNRPPLAPEGPNGANPHIRVNTDVANSAHQDPGLHGTSQDPGASSHPQHPVFARPLFYVHAPPPPPFLQYQWPMPFPYNPFPGFLGMGYGMVMPPLPPPPYLESPAYIVPHPQVQPVDYRRLLHPQAHSHAPGGPLQNLNQTRRIRLPHTNPVRETVNSEVQTEPIHRGGGGYEGCPIPSSDSGRATASNSPSSLSSSSQKQGSAEVETYMLSSTEAKEQVKEAGTNGVKHGCNIVPPTGMTVQSSRRATQEMQGCEDGAVQEPSLIPTCRIKHRNIWSVSSQDSMGPVCSASQTEDEVKERRISVPDILSWGGGTSQTAMTMAAEAGPQNNHECYENEVEHEKSVYQSPSKPKSYPVVVSSVDDVDTEVISSSKDREMIFKILRLPSLLDPFSLSTRDADSVELVKPCLSNRDEILQALNALRNGTENGSEMHEEPTENTPNHASLSRCQMNKNINESVWSVESLAPFIPTKEWVQQNSVFEPEVIVEMERAENVKWSTKKDGPIGKFAKERRQSSRFSSPDSVLVSECVLTFSTPAKKQSPPKNPDMVCETEVSETKGTEESQSAVPSGKHPLISLTTLQGIILTASTDEDMNQNGSSDPEANQSPNQGTVTNEQEEKGSLERKETCFINSAADDKVSSTSQMTLQNYTQMEVATGAHKVDCQMGDVELGVPATDQKIAQVTPSKGTLVDCAIQCTELQGLKCLCEELKGSMGSNRKPHKYPDLKKANDGKPEAFCMQKNSKRNGHWRNRGPEKHNSQQENCNGYGSRPGKLKGGSGRNPRY